MREEDSFRLGERAEIIRCQTPRRKIDARGEQLIMGELPDGRILCREVGVGDIDRDSGFAEPETSRTVEFMPTARGEKYLLRENDILFAFAGVSRALALTGLMTQTGEPAIPARTICVIRAFDIDPVWLFYQLRGRRIKSALTALAVGKSGSALTINIEDLRGARLPLPSSGEISATNSAHARILEESKKIRAVRENVRREQARINSLFALNRRESMSLSR